jgi:hypothetical protein
MPMDRSYMNRQMFQEGGLADPVMEAQMAEDQEAMMIGQSIGEEMAQGIDQAENFEEMINAIRGDVKPIEFRKQELGLIVGNEDAQMTPDSVLALVQPIVVIELQARGMLDEQGMVMDESVAQVQPDQMAQPSMVETLDRSGVLGVQPDMEG